MNTKLFGFTTIINLLAYQKGLKSLDLPFLPIGRSFVKQSGKEFNSASLAMGRSSLGEFEELVLLTGPSMKVKCGAAITGGIQQKTGGMAFLSFFYSSNLNPSS